MLRLEVKSPPPSPLLQLARHNGLDSAVETNQQLSDWMQQNWLRTTQHQYQISGGPPDETSLELLRQLGFVDERAAPPGTYIAACLLGATRPAVIKRLYYLKDLHQRGVMTALVYLLGGARPLNEKLESREQLLKPSPLLPFKEGWTPPRQMPKTEAPMMQLTFDQSELPPIWQGNLINTSMQRNADGSDRRPNTTDTTQLFIKRAKPEPGKYLCVSSQPYVFRQARLFQSVLSEAGQTNIELYGIGPAANPELALAKYLDEVARYVYVATKS